MLALCLAVCAHCVQGLHRSNHTLAFQQVAAHGDTLFVRAEWLLAAGRLGAARRIAEKLQDRRPHDPRVLTFLGRIHLVWPVVGPRAP